MPNPIIEHFEWTHLPPHLAQVSAPLCSLAKEMDAALGDGPEKGAGLRKLLEAKDCLVRQAVLDHKARERAMAMKPEADGGKL